MNVETIPAKALLPGVVSASAWMASVRDCRADEPVPPNDGGSVTCRLKVADGSAMNNVVWSGIPGNARANSGKDEDLQIRVDGRGVRENAVPRNALEEKTVRIGSFGAK